MLLETLMRNFQKYETPFKVTALTLFNYKHEASSNKPEKFLMYKSTSYKKSSNSESEVS